MQPCDVKNALLNYHEYRKSVLDETDAIAEINARLYKSGGSIVKMPEQPKDRGTVIVEAVTEKDKIIPWLSMHQYLVELADDFIRWVPEPYRRWIEWRYIEGKSLDWIADEAGYHKSQMYRIIDKLIEKYVEEC